ncbi:MAG: hemerythrin domain-containing protein [Chloroflexi bacterium]|nr:hemerythrin domain-containing protein [Chloroflexota bacterium]
MPLEALKEGHRRALQAVERVKAAGELARQGETAQAIAIVRGLLPFLERDQRVHFRQEEEGLFLYLRHIIGDGPVQAMVGEHESYWTAIATLKRLLDGSGSASELQRQLQHIFYLLDGHIQKEESAYFPVAEKKLSAAQLQEVDDEMEAIARLG